MPKVLYVLQISKCLMLLTICLTSMITMDVFGAITVKNINSSKQDQVFDVDNMNKDEIIATLKNDIKAIDEQMAQCKKQKKGWTAATVIGGIGIVGTGIGALVQNNQIQNKKSELKSAQDELRSIE